MLAEIVQLLADLQTSATEKAGVPDIWNAREDGEGEKFEPPL